MRAAGLAGGKGLGKILLAEVEIGPKDVFLVLRATVHHAAARTVSAKALAIGASMEDFDLCAERAPWAKNPGGPDCSE